MNRITERTISTARDAFGEVLDILSSNCPYASWFDAFAEMRKLKNFIDLVESEMKEK